MKNYGLLFVFCILLFFVSCTADKPEGENPAVSEETMDSTSQKTAQVQIEAPKVEAPVHKIIEFNLQEDIVENTLTNQHFGKFFDERAEFYIIEQPYKTILSANVEKITLFYLDGRLSKLKYILDSNISNELLNNYGSCVIKGLDPEDRYQMKHSEFIFKKDNKYSLSESLNNYQLQWDLEDKYIVMRVRTLEAGKFYEYEEKAKNYESYMKAMQRDYLSL